ncbi:patatin-like phospholipase family protein [Aureimonas fodinaquatilis]|uniref:Patatin-like phospholipase family protein n=1 Tax=Aureimonas fodinaquatilis TaxID=2565783 RepID=A0A5B0DZ07_9HYPH|nr:patatin-like phospholipase family protein [Aureimonas fodinaquatilis]KAA0972044.1 patatin-like phospholipase family protein [Aureimonas fodinaquatilis]
MVEISLALQGGGAHGAFTWGVLDRLLESGRFDMTAVSGTSAGALNAASLVTGLAAGGADAARANLENLWRLVSEGSPLGAAEQNMPFFPLPRPVVHSMLERMKILGQLVSPYDPAMPKSNSLRPVVERAIDFALLQSAATIPTFVSATRVDTGAARIFTGAELTVDALLASACLPDLFRAVEIDGVSYWDGGYMGNPVLKPLLAEGRASDLLIIQVTPFQRAEVPQTVGDILSRITEITFNSSLMRDLRTLTSIQKLLDGQAHLNPALQHLAGLRLHMISAGPEIGARSSAAKLDTRWSELTGLANAGRKAAELWLETHGSDIGQRSTVDSMLEPFV